MSGNNNKQVALTDAQRKVMKWLGKGWRAYLNHGTVVYINGARACGLSTIESLIKKGFVQPDGRNCWHATEAGCTATRQLGL